FDELRASSPEDFIVMVGKAIANVKDPSDRMALAVQLLGRQFRELLPALLPIIENFEKLKRSGLTDAEIATLDEAGDMLTRMGNKMLVWGSRAMVGAVETFRKAIELMKQSPGAFEMGAEIGNVVEFMGAPPGHPQTHEAAPERAAKTSATVFEDVQKKIDAVTKGLEKQITALKADEIAFTQGEDAALRFKLVEEALAELEGMKLTPRMREQIETIVRLTAVTKERERGIALLNNELKQQEKLEADLNKAVEGTFDLQHELSRLSMDDLTKALDDVNQQFNKLQERNDELRKQGFGVNPDDIERLRASKLLLAEIDA